MQGGGPLVRDLLENQNSTKSVLCGFGHNKMSPYFFSNRSAPIDFFMTIIWSNPIDKFIERVFLE